MSKTEQIRKAALIMIERYGDGALRQVDIRIEELWAHENEDARKLWVEIRHVVETLTKKPTNGRKH